MISPLLCRDSSIIRSTGAAMRSCAVRARIYHPCLRWCTLLASCCPHKCKAGPLKVGATQSPAILLQHLCPRHVCRRVGPCDFKRRISRHACPVMRCLPKRTTERGLRLARAMVEGRSRVAQLNMQAQHSVHAAVVPLRVLLLGQSVASLQVP